MTLATAAAIDTASEARSAMYGALSRAWGFPDRELHACLQDGSFRDEVAAIAAGLPYALDASDIERLAAVDDYVDVQAEYIRLFDVGAVRPPCPLYGGEWGMPRRRSMEDALRFYQYFGLKLNADERELPDHATVQFEFMQVMAFTEGTARARDADTGALLRAERDFLARHLGRWWPLLRGKVATLEPLPFYDALTALTDAFVAEDARYLKQLVRGLPVPDGDD